MFPQMFPCLPTRGNIVAETKFASREAKMFPIPNSEKFDVSLCFSLMFPIVFAHFGKHGETLAGNNVSATMFPSLPWA
jgi:hypothetical protein